MTSSPDIDALWNTLLHSGRDLAVLAPLSDAYAEVGETAMVECLKWCWEKGRRPRKLIRYGYTPMFAWYADAKSKNFEFWKRGCNCINGPSNIPDLFVVSFGRRYDELRSAYEDIGTIWKRFSINSIDLVRQWSPTLKPRKVYG